MAPRSLDESHRGGGGPPELRRDPKAEIRVMQRRDDLAQRVAERVVADGFDRWKRRPRRCKCADGCRNVRPLVHDVNRTPFGERGICQPR